MRHHEIEAWALGVIRRVEASQPNEDSRVELRADWPDAKKAARHIAGHANAARGASILWQIGVDEKQGVHGASNVELANWGRQFDSCFDGLPPNIVDLNIPFGDKTVVALFIETDRAPFVVKNPAGGKVQREVPWRENRSTKTATRSDLLVLLSPLQRLPAIEVLTAELTVRKPRPQQKLPPDTLVWYLLLRLYLVPVQGEMPVIPFHRCHGSFEIPGAVESTEFTNVSLHPPKMRTASSGVQNLSLTIRSTNNELLIEGPGKVMLEAQAATPHKQGTFRENAHVTITLTAADLNAGSITLNESLEYAGVPSSDTLGFWKTVNNDRYQG